MLSGARHAARSVRQSPLFFTVVVLTLALGTGANAAIFGVVSAVILEPLRYADTDRLVVIHERASRIPNTLNMPVNAVHAEHWRQTTRSFEQIAILREANATLTGSGEPERLTVGRVSSTLFAMLGIHPRLGRTFLDEEDRAGSDQVVILSHEFWARRFASNPEVIGQRLILDDRPYVVVGVLPEDFRFPRFSDLYPISVGASTPQVWKPFGLRDEERSPAGDFNYACIAKLRPGITLGEAASELKVAQTQFEARLSERLGLSAVVVPLADQVASRSRTGVWLLQVAAAIVLLIVCVNVASLLAGRTSARRHEFAVRRALGASAVRITTQMLAECAVVGAAAAFLGLAIAYVALRVIDRLAPVELPRVNEITLNPRVWMFMLAVSVLATTMVGLVQAWRATRSRDVDATRDTHRTASASRTAVAFRSTLVVGQVALSAVSLVVAGLLVHSFAKLTQVDKGFDPRQLLSVELNLSPQRYTSLGSTTTFVRTLLDRLSQQAGISDVGVISQAPLAGVGGNNRLLAEGDPDALSRGLIVDFRPVNADYFRTMRIPLETGRVFNDADGARPVALVSTAAARSAWPGQDPIGKRFRLGNPQGPLIEVVGVVGDIRGVSLSDPPTATVYLPFWQRAFTRNRLTLLVKNSAESGAITSTVRNTIRGIDAEMALSEFRTMPAIVDASAASRRFQMELLMLFAVTALALTVLGTYAMMSYGVAERATEIGIRLALGEPRGRVIHRALTEATRLTMAGLAAGLPIALLVGLAIRRLLFGVVPHDAVTFVTVAAVLILTALLAAAVPAWRASRVDPAIALKQS